MTSIFVASVHGKWMPSRFGAERQKVLNDLRADGLYGGDTWAIGLRVDNNYNAAIKDFLASDADYILMLNDDMTYPDHVGRTLLEAEMPLIGGLYFSREGEWKGLPHFYKEAGVKKDEWGRPTKQYLPMVKETLEGVQSGNPVIPIAATGTGCLLIERWVLETMQGPWFESIGSLMGDLRFFHTIYVQAYGHCGVQCGHITDAVLGVEYFIKTATEMTVGV